MPDPATATMTAAEFDRRVQAAEAYENRGLAWVWSPAGIALVVFLVAVALGEERAELLGNVAVIVMMPSILGGLVLMLVREQSAVGRFGLQCPGCGMPLPGGRSNESTIHVRETGCCATCGAPVLRDHPGARETAAREAAVPRTTPRPPLPSRATTSIAGWRARAGACSGGSTSSSRRAWAGCLLSPASRFCRGRPGWRRSS